MRVDKPDSGEIRGGIVGPAPRTEFKKPDEKEKFDTEQFQADMLEALGDMIESALGDIRNEIYEYIDQHVENQVTIIKRGGTTYTAGDGINIDGNVISSALDQCV